MENNIPEEAKLTDTEIRAAILFSPQVKFGADYRELSDRAIADAASEKAYQKGRADACVEIADTLFMKDWFGEKLTANEKLSACFFIKSGQALQREQGVK